MIKTLIVLRGLPGTGKSTFAELLVSPENICEADHYFEGENGYEFDASRLEEAHSQCHNKVEALMQSGAERIVVSNTSTQLWEFSEYLALARQHHYRVHVAVVENWHNGNSKHKVPNDVMRKMRQGFELKI